MQTTIIVKHEAPGFHFWPDAPTMVEYLASKHRHLFKFVVAWKVGHDDRDIEFHTAQHWVAALVVPDQNYGAMSCEMIAKQLQVRLVAAGQPAPVWIEVWEDGECGARVEW